MTTQPPAHSDLSAQVQAHLQGQGVATEAAQVARLTKALTRLAQPQPLAVDPASRDFDAVLQRCRHA